jgi:hypothetical protein
LTSAVTKAEGDIESGTLQDINWLNFWSPHRTPT